MENQPIIEKLGDGWTLENKLPSNSSRLVRPDGVTVFYRYMETSYEEAKLVKWAYENGHKAGIIEQKEKLKVILGLDK